MKLKYLLSNFAHKYRNTDKKVIYHTPAYSELIATNYISYKQMPGKDELAEDIDLLHGIQKDYPSVYYYFEFPEGIALPKETKQFLTNNNFDLDRIDLLVGEPAELSFSPLNADIDLFSIDKDNFAWMQKYISEIAVSYGQQFKKEVSQYDLDFIQKNKGNHIFIAKEYESVVGALKVIEGEKTLEIDDFQVLPEYRRNGIGSALQQEAVKIAGNRKVILATISNSEEEKMYFDQGYRKVSFYDSALYYPGNDWEDI